MNNANILKVLQDMQQVSNRLEPAAFLIALLASLAASLVASLLYRFFYENRGTGSQINRSFPLLGISITTLFIGVQVSLPLSLGLLGALSIIRFRTPVKEPEEVGFVMLVIAAAISCATFQFQFLVILYLVAIFSLFLVRGLRLWKYLKRDGILLVEFPDEEGGGISNAVVELAKKNSHKSQLESSVSRDGITSLQISFSGLKTDTGELQDKLRAAGPMKAVSVFLDRPGGIR